MVEHSKRGLLALFNGKRVVKTAHNCWTVEEYQQWKDHVTKQLVEQGANPNDICHRGGNISIGSQVFIGPSLHARQEGVFQVLGARYKFTPDGGGILGGSEVKNLKVAGCCFEVTTTGGATVRYALLES